MDSTADISRASDNKENLAIKQKITLTPRQKEILIKYLDNLERGYATTIFQRNLGLSDDERMDAAQAGKSLILS